jgi:signal transduction histidine kinase
MNGQPANFINIFLEKSDLYARRDETLHELLELLRNETGACACSLRFLQDDMLLAGVCTGYPHPEKRKPAIRLDQTLRNWFREGEPLIIQDIGNEPLLKRSRKAYWLDQGFRSALLLPIYADGRTPRAVFSLFFDRVGAVASDTPEFLMRIRPLFSLILDRVLYYEDVAEIQHLVQNIVESTTDAVLLTDILGKILYVGRRATEILHRRRTSLLGKFIFQVDSRLGPAFEEALRKMARRSRPLSFEAEAGKRAHELVYLQGQVIKLKLHRTGNETLLWILQDRSQLRRTEKALQKKRQELEDFVYSISHDLKAPIVSLQGYASLLCEEGNSTLDEQKRHYLQRIRANAEMMQSMIQDLLQLSRANRVSSTFRLESFGAILKETLEEFHYQLTRKNIQVEYPERFPRVTCNRMGIKLVLSNLISNAIKFMGRQPKPRIEIGWQKGPQQLIFYVHDNGNGMDQEIQQKIFQPFFRGPGMDKVEGTGIGLAIVRKVIEQHQGQVWVESSPGKGSTFFFSLPHGQRAPVLASP